MRNIILFVFQIVNGQLPSCVNRDGKRLAWTRGSEWNELGREMRGGVETNDDVELLSK